MAPYAPHIAEELWEKIGNTESLTYADWPKWDEKSLVQQTVNVAVKVSTGKRPVVVIQCPADASNDAVLAMAKSHPKVAAKLEGMDIIREIVVPKKLVNLVVKPSQK